MFKDTINRIATVTDVISISDLRNISDDKYTSYKATYTSGITRLKRGLYSLKDSIESSRVANKLVTPSYISLETVLSHYSIIPDVVVSYSSVTTKTTNYFHNQLGTFYYYNLKEDLYFGYKYENEIFIAEKEKALLDYFYLKSKALKLTVYDYAHIEKGKYASKGCKSAFVWFEAERLENLEILDFEKLVKYSKKFNKKVYYMVILLRRYYLKNEAQFTTKGNEL